MWKLFNRLHLEALSVPNTEYKIHPIRNISSTMWNLTATIMVTSPLLWLPRQQSYIAIKITAEYT